MPTYIMLSRFTEQGLGNIKDSPGRLETAKQTFKGLGAAFVTTIAVLLASPVVVQAAPPVCGDNVRVGPEDCDGTGDAKCPGECQADCTCPAPRSLLLETYGKLPLAFEANQGQTDPQVKFLSRGSGYTLSLTPTEVVFSFRKPQGRRSLVSHQRSSKPNEEQRVIATELRMQLVGANPTPEITGLEELPGKSNYFIGNRSTWHTNIPRYAKVRYEAVYPGIDLIFYGNPRQLEYDLVVAPGADPAAIRLAFKGADTLSLDDEGNLILHAEWGDVIQRAPFVYQEINGSRQPILGSYVMKENHEVSFQVAAYDTEKPLVIDPVLEYSTYLSRSVTQHNSIAVDSSGSAYVTGSNLGVIKLSADGSTVIYQSTIVQGVVEAIAVDSSGRAYVLGTTSAPGLATPGAAQPVFGGGGQDDAFVALLSDDGSDLLYFTYLGGNSLEVPLGIALGRTIFVGGVPLRTPVFVSGFTASDDFRTTDGALQPDFGGGFGDAFVAIVNPAGTGMADLVYSTFLGGSGHEGFVGGIAREPGSSNIYVTGFTDSNDFPKTAGAFQDMLGAFGATFVAKINPAGTGMDDLVYSTYLMGTDGESGGAAITVDGFGNAYVVGDTDASDFPTTPGAFRTAPPTVLGQVFVTKLNPAGTDLVYSTYLGPGVASGIALGTDHSVFVTGHTASAVFPMVIAFQDTFGGATDAFVAMLNPQGTALNYSSYLGGTPVIVDPFQGLDPFDGLAGPGNEHGTGIAVDSSNNAYVTGFTTSFDFPTTAGAFDVTCGSDAFPSCDGVVFLEDNKVLLFADAFVSKITTPNTLTGMDVFVNFAGGVIIYSEVTVAGDTTVTETTTNPGPPLPGFEFQGNFFDIVTDAVFAGDVLVCLSYDDNGLTLAEEEMLAILHLEPNPTPPPAEVYVDRTEGLDTESNFICASVPNPPGLSPFVVVPEPSSLILLITGTGLLGGLYRLRRGRSRFA